MSVKRFFMDIPGPGSIEMFVNSMEEAKEEVAKQFVNCGVIPIVARTYQLIHEQIEYVDTGPIEE